MPYVRSFAVRPSNYGKFERECAANVKRNIKRAMEDIRRYTEQKLRQATIDVQPPGARLQGAVATGSLRDAWSVVPDSKLMSVQIVNNAKNKANNFEYPRVIDLGARPNKYKKFPIKQILVWMAQRGIGTGKKRHDRAIAFSISKKIQDFGIAPRGIIALANEGTTGFVAYAKRVLYKRCQELLAQSRR